MSDEVMVRSGEVFAKHRMRDVVLRQETELCRMTGADDSLLL